MKELRLGGISLLQRVDGNVVIKDHNGEATVERADLQDVARFLAECVDHERKVVVHGRCPACANDITRWLSRSDWLRLALHLDGECACRQPYDVIEVTQFGTAEPDDWHSLLVEWPPPGATFNPPSARAPMPARRLVRVVVAGCGLGGQVA